LDNAIKKSVKNMHKSNLFMLDNMKNVEESSAKVQGGQSVVEQVLNVNDSVGKLSNDSNRSLSPRKKLEQNMKPILSPRNSN
jgi:hypothetical protein